MFQIWWIDYEDPDPNVTRIGDLKLLKFIQDGLIGLTNNLMDLVEG